MLRNELMPEWSDMQGLVMTAYDAWPESVYMLFRFREVQAAQTWLREQVLPRVTAVEKRAHRAEYPETNVNVAFTFTGLDALAAVSGQRPVGFSRAFTEGIDGNEHRSRILGDVGAAESRRWSWGGRWQPVDLLVMVFGRTSAALADTLDHILPPRGCMASSAYIQGTNRSALRMAGTPNMREHFGFADGISQPILAGTDEAERFPESRHLTALGEFVLGYPNASDQVAAVPALSRSATFGRNGSYLVVRQLEQNFNEFWQYCQRAAAGDATLAEQIAEKIVGRRRDGTPLVPMTSHTDNEFGFADDAYGYGCPMGSHIRRANPRDSFENTNDPAQPAITTNKHRLLRRGRPYGTPVEPGTAATDHPDDRRGLMFICLNASIEQQFEFIQQNWVNSSEFLGVPGECDPLIGRRAATARRNRFTIPALPVAAQIDGLGPFVEVRGGAYFFMPGLSALSELTR